MREAAVGKYEPEFEREEAPEDPQAATTTTTTARSSIAPRRCRLAVASRRWAGTLVLIRRGW
jgi:hypothetical protein